jgi:hypothetical protein
VKDEYLELLKGMLEYEEEKRKNMIDLIKYFGDKH